MVNKNVGFICAECGNTNQKWLGKCPQCNQWNTYSELSSTPKKVSKGNRPVNSSQFRENKTKPELLNEISIQDTKRYSTNLVELDRVLGGGLVQGSTVLLGGEPGIGKSTLLLQLSMNLASGGFKVLYASGEENSLQVRIRSGRLGSVPANIYFLSNGNVEAVEEAFHSIKPNLLIIDSIQTSETDTHPSGPGSIAQIRDSAHILSNLVSDTPITNSNQGFQKSVCILTAHVTKDGTIAGPKLLEHLVDTVLYFEGDRYRNLRLVKAYKNRFGAINEIGLFKMTERGLKEVESPTNYFLDPREASLPPGSVIVPVKEGSLILLLEVQSLVNEILYQTPKRASEGVELNRVQLMSAVLDKFGNLNLRNYDIFVRISGGVYVDDPGLDLGLIISLASSLKERSIPSDTCFIAEISLSGKLRGVSMLRERIAVLESLNIKRVIIPESQAAEFDFYSGEIIGLKNIREVIEYIF